LKVLYNIPIPLSQVERIANIARILGKRGGNVRLLIDDEAQIPPLLQISELSGYPPNVYIAIDGGSHILGAQPSSASLLSLFRKIEEIVLRAGPITIAFVGFYCHGNHDQTVRSQAAMLGSFESHLKLLLESLLVEEIRLAVPETPILAFLPEVLSNLEQNFDPGYELLVPGINFERNKVTTSSLRGERFSLLLNSLHLAISRRISEERAAIANTALTMYRYTLPTTLCSI